MRSLHREPPYSLRFYLYNFFIAWFNHNCLKRCVLPAPGLRGRLTTSHFIGPKEQTVGEIQEFQKLFLAPGFLSYTVVLIIASLVIIFYFAPRYMSIFLSFLFFFPDYCFRYGKKSMLWYIGVCSMIGGISVSVTTGLGAAIVQTAYGDNQVYSCFCPLLSPCCSHFVC